MMLWMNLRSYILIYNGDVMKLKLFVNPKKYTESHRYICKKYYNNIPGLYKYEMSEMRHSYGSHSSRTGYIRINLGLINKDFSCDRLLDKIYDVILHESLHPLIYEEEHDVITQHSYIFRITDFFYPGFINDETKKWFLME